MPNNVYCKASTVSVDLPYWYTEIFGEYPVYKCTFTVNREDEDEEFDINQEIYDDLVATGKFTPICYEYDYGDNDKKDMYVHKFYLLSEDEKVAVTYEYGDIAVVTHLGTDVIDSVVDRYLKKYNQDFEDTRCYIIVKDDNLYLKDFSIDLKGDLDFGLYNEGFEDVHKDMSRSIKEDKNGLYLLYGAPGTGKTTYIKHLIKECATDKRKFIYVPSNLFGDFTNPVFLPFLMDHRGCVFIIEDCESLVTMDNGIRSNELTDLLNMTDGLLADALDIKIICTFNIDDGRIDDALLRPGRCRCRYEFDLLEKDRANVAAEKLGLKPVTEDVTLADLFNSGKNFKEKKKKMGFR